MKMPLIIEKMYRAMYLYGAKKGGIYTMQEVKKAAASYIEELTKYISNKPLLTTQIQGITKCVVDVITALNAKEQTCFNIKVEDKFTLNLDGTVVTGEVTAVLDYCFLVKLSTGLSFYLPLNNDFLQKMNYTPVKETWI